MTKKLCAIVLAMMLAFTMLTSVGYASNNGVQPYYFGPSSHTFPVNGATATASLEWHDATSGDSNGYIRATTAIDRAQLCSVAANVSGKFRSFAAGEIEDVYGSGNGINACQAFVYRGDGVFSQVRSVHTAYYNGVTEYYYM